MANLRLSTIPLYASIEKREILGKYIDTQDEFKGIVDYLEMLGQYSATDNKTFQTFTTDQAFKSTTVTSTGLTSKAYQFSGDVTVADGSNVTVGDFMVGPDGTVFYVRAKNGNTLTCYNPNAGAASTIANGATVTFPTSGIAEGGSSSGIPIIGTTTRSNQLQYFDTYTESSDIALGSRIELDVNGQNHFFQLQSHIAFMKHRAKIGNAFLMGKKIVASDASGLEVPMTRGLNDYCSEGVNTTAANSSNAPIDMAKSDLRAFSRALDAAKSPDEGMFWVGGELSASIDDTLDGLLASGGVKYDAFGKGNSKQKAVDMGIQSFTLYDRTFHKSKLSVFENAGTTSATGSFYPETGYFIPSGNVGTVDGGSVPRIEGKYLNLPNGLAGRYHEIETGGLAETPTDRTSVLGYTHKSWEGLSISSPEHFGKFSLYG